QFRSSAIPPADQRGWSTGCPGELSWLKRRPTLPVQGGRHAERESEAVVRIGDWRIWLGIVGVVAALGLAVFLPTRPGQQKGASVPPGGERSQPRAGHSALPPRAGEAHRPRQTPGADRAILELQLPPGARITSDGQELDPRRHTFLGLESGRLHPREVRI